MLWGCKCNQLTAFDNFLYNSGGRIFSSQYPYHIETAHYYLLCKVYNRENILLTNKNNAVILTPLFYIMIVLINLIAGDNPCPRKCVDLQSQVCYSFPWQASLGYLWFGELNIL